MLSTILYRAEPSRSAARRASRRRLWAMSEFRETRRLLRHIREMVDAPRA